MLVLVAVLAVIAAAAEAGVVLLVAPVVEAVAGDSGSGVDLGPVVLLGVAILVKNLVVALQSWFKNKELFAIQADVSERLLDTYIRGSNPHVQGLDAGRRTSFAIIEPLQLVLNGYQPLVTIVAEALTLFALVAVLVAQHPVESLLLAASLGLLLTAFGRLTRSRIIAAGVRRKESDTVRQEVLRSVIESRAEVNGLGVAEVVLDRYRGPNEASATTTAHKAFLTEASKNVLEVLVVLAVGPIVLAFSASDGTDLVAMLATYGVAAYRAMPGLNRLMVASQSLRFGVATVETLSEILTADDAVSQGTGGPPRPADGTPSDGGDGDGALDLAFGDFRLRNGKPVLTGRSLHLEPGEMCVLWGPSGGGKSTVLEALVDGGEGLEVRYGGRLLPRGLSELPGMVGVTAQSPLILPGSLEDNLTLQHAPLDLDEVRPLLDDDPSSILDASSVGRRLGSQLHRHSVSGGQAQRISLIRALDHRNRVVVLDEPTSALDSRSASAVRDRLAADREGRIVLVVTHDPRLREIADTVVELT